MFPFQFALPTFYLIVISIINYVCAPLNPESMNLCREILYEELYFNESDDGGLLNFQSAFEFLTAKRIRDNFSPPYQGYETNEEKHIRELKEYITLQYYMDLLGNSNIEVSLLKTPVQWCQDRLKEKNLDPKIHQNEEERMKDCLKYTRLLLKNENNENDPRTILHVLYLDWCTNKLRTLQKNVPDQYFDDPSAWKFYKEKYAYNVKEFSEEYFNYYVNLIKNEDLIQGNFRSINQFCEFAGHILVGGSIGNSLNDILQNLQLS